jgi:hypothetical protein
MPAVSPKPRLRLVAAASFILGGAMILATSASSQSVTPQSVDPMQHFIDCAGVLISAPDVHAANCLPNNIPPEMKSLGGATEDKPLSDCVDDDVWAFDAVDECLEEPYPPG